MNFIYFILNSASILILIFLMVIIYKNRAEKGAKPFFVALLCLMLWATSTSFELVSTSLEDALVWRNVTQIGMAFMPVFSLLFVMAYISYKGKMLWGLVAFSIVSNVIILFLTFTDDMHHLIRKSVDYTISNGYYNLIVEPSILGNLHVTFRFILTFLVILFLFRFQIKIFESMKTQVLTLGFGMFVTVLFLVIKHYWLARYTTLLPMSLSFIILYTFIAISIFKFHFLKINPLAKDWIINSLDEGIVVFSKSGKIVEVNPAANAFFLERLSIDSKLPLSSVESRVQLNLFSAVYSQIINCDHPIHDESDCTFKNSWVVNGEMKYYEFQMHYLVDSQSKKMGAVTVIRDVSRREREKNELMIKAEIDMQTGIYNSRGFIERFDQSYGEMRGLFIIDIDNFKHINDQFGHPVGDEVLKHIVSAINLVVGDQAILGRLGGDEFGLMLSVEDHDKCKYIAKELIRIIDSEPYKKDYKIVKVTISLGGITCIPINTAKFDQIYPVADKLLYQSKGNGRNQYTLKKYDSLSKI